VSNVSQLKRHDFPEQVRSMLSDSQVLLKAPEPDISQTESLKLLLEILSSVLCLKSQDKLKAGKNE